MNEPKPLSLDVLNEFSEDYEAWVIQSQKTGKYLVIPDSRFPGRRPIRFFMAESDAATLIQAVLRENQALGKAGLLPVKVKLHAALRGIAADTNPEHADSFVVHSRNEVFDFVKVLDQPN